MEQSPRICVIGLGYVGLPLAVALARHFTVSGFDVDATRIAELRERHDRTLEVDAELLGASALALLDAPNALAGHDLFIITVPTPVDSDHRPDLGAVESAAATVGRVLRRGNVVVLESTVYPGVTEQVCGPLLERASGLVCGRDFFLGYSPERINPGDREHTLERITKVVAGQTPAVTELLAHVYGAVNGGNIFRARDIKTAEAAKVIENAQRDINIAFINEVAAIVGRMDLSVYDVLDAARTKWNFLPFAPGLVGGHCIGVDPFYLAAAATRVGHHPEIILAGRRINDAMGAALAARIAAALPSRPQRILVLGLTFKENVPDLRNSRVVDLIGALAAHGHTVEVHDPLASPREAAELYDIRLLPDIAGLSRAYDAVVGAVPHRVYRDLSADALAALLRPDGLLADIKGMWRGLVLPPGLRRWQL
jgi:UDP-N-acetyl-D-galactosamine dehydrogenase